MKYAAGNIEKVHVLRIQPGEDVLNCIQAYCDQHHILNGVILSGHWQSGMAGTFFDPQEIPGKPGCYGYVTAINLPTPIELVGLNGIICAEPSGSAAPSYSCLLCRQGWQ